ncbi:MAG TPA: DMT family transporter [Stellaceae bacterium]|nr:DMT family transporter [Stellaceae bacterium]
MSMPSVVPQESGSITRYQLGLLLVTLSAVAWSTAGFFTRLIPLDAWTTVFWRGIFGTLAGLVFIMLRERRGTWRAFSGMGWIGILLSLLSMAGMLTFLTALKLTTVAHVSIVYATTPFMAAGLAWLAMRERVSPATLVASAFALCGVALTVINGFGEGDIGGDVLALCMTLLMAIMIVAVRRTKIPVPMLPAACLSALLSCLISLPFASPLSASPVDLFNLVLFGISNMVLGLILFMIGARLIPAAQTALIGALDAPLAPIWVWLAFGETPKLTTAIGGGVVLLSVLGHILYENKRSRGMPPHIPTPEHL